MYFFKIRFKDFIHLFVEKGEGREKERERNIDARETHGSVASCMCRNKGLNLGIEQVTFCFTQPTEPPQPGLFICYEKCFSLIVILHSSIFKEQRGEREREREREKPATIPSPRNNH